MEKNPKTWSDIAILNLSGDEFVTSDTHFGHKNVAMYCGRPWTDTDEMDAEITRRWNAVVKPDDTVIHFGDFAFKGTIFKTKMLKKLNGYKVLVKGNHDSGRETMIKCGFDEAYLIIEGVLWDGRSYAGAHVPQPLMSKLSGVHLCGHVHEKWAFIAPNIYNVGCDQWGFVPQRIKHVLEHAENRQRRLPNQITMESWFEPRDQQLSHGMYGRSGKGGLRE